MEDVLKIDPEKEDQLMMRESLESMLLGGLIPILFFALLILVISQDLEATLKMIWAVKAYILGYLVFMFMLKFIGRSSVVNAKYLLTETHVMRGLFAEDLGTVTNYFHERAERKSGQKKVEIIPISNLQSIEIKKNYVKFKAFDYNMWNGNGLVKIPKEVQQYEEVVALAKKIKKEKRK